MGFDVAVVGASSAGLYAAERLAAGGAQVALFERYGRVDPPRRTLIITPEIERLLEGLPERARLNNTSHIRLGAGEREVTLALHEPDLIVERGALARWLFERAAGAGARVYLNHRFRGFEPRPGGLELTFETPSGRRRAQARAVIGADGIASDVGRAAGLPHPSVEPLVQAEIALPEGWDPTTTQVWFEPAETPYFYWLIPEREGRAVLGLIGDGRRDAGDLVRTTLARRGWRPLRFQGARVAMHHPRLRPWSLGNGAPVYLIGDAAGQVKVTTVGGTVTGLAGAAAAAEAILTDIPYAKALRPLKRELDLQWGIRLLLDQLERGDYERLLDCLTPRLRAFLAGHNRDRMFPAFWRLLLEPRLALFGLVTLAHLLAGSARRTRVRWGKRGEQGSEGAGERGR